MKRSAVAVTILILSFVLWIPVNASPILPELLGVEGLQELHNVREDINILNLLNVLYLTSSQIDELLDIHDIRETIIETAKSRLTNEVPSATRTFSALRHTILGGRNPEERLVHEAHLAERTVMEIIGEATKKYKSLVDEAELVFNDSQKTIVSYYVACLVPPKSDVNPTRVGETDNQGPRKHLEKIRELKEDEYTKRKEEIVQNIYGHIEQLAKAHPNISLEGVREKVADYIDKIRSMPEVEFKLYNRNPIKEILGPPPGEQQEAGDIRPKTEKFILHPRAGVLLRQLKSRGNQ